MATINGGDGPDFLFGTLGSDTVNGGAGNDTLIGGDVLNNADGFPDLLVGGTGDDVFQVEERGDTVLELPGEGKDQVDTKVLKLKLFDNVENLVADGPGNFRLAGNDLDNVILGNFGRDRLSGGKGNDNIAGIGGGDTLDGGSGDDTLLGGDPRDSGPANDVLIGGAGADVLFGGGGADRFVYLAASDSKGKARDIVLDFVRGTDTIDLSAIDADADATNGDTAFTFIGTAAFGMHRGELRVESKHGAFRVSADLDGDGKADMAFDVSTADAPNADWFAL